MTFRQLLLIVALSLATVAVHAQAAPITFTASVTNANGTLNTTLTWSAPGATGCTASGDPNWTGAKAASGTQIMPPISLSGSYVLKLDCSFPGVTTATISWTSPTTNTDGTPLAQCPSQTPGSACLLQFKVYRTITPPLNLATADFKLIDDRTATSFVWSNVPQPGTNTFAVTALNGLFAESPISNTATKVITATTSSNASVTLTVNPIPGPPTGVTVK